MAIRTPHDRYEVVDVQTGEAFGNHTHAEAVSRAQAMRRNWSYRKTFEVRATGKPSDIDRLSKIDEAIDDSIIEASEKELREDFAEQGHDFDKAVERVGSVIEKAKAACGHDWRDTYALIDVCTLCGEERA